MNKNEARKIALDLRKNTDRVDLSAYIKGLNILDKYKHIGIYYPIGKEIDITNLVNLYMDKVFYLPKTLDDLVFIKYDNDTKLIDGPFKTKEPVGLEVDRDLIDCFIIPCVGVNKDKKRIGYGKGYYDRYLSGYQGFKIGIVYNNANNLDVILDDYDITLDLVITG